MNNKKTLILSIVGVLVLVIAVVGISFAMYNFAGTGTTENVITTGKITVNYPDASENAEKNINLTSAYPSTDAVGSVHQNICVNYTGDEAPTTAADCTAANGTWENNQLTFDISAEVGGSAKIAYEIAIDPIAGNTLDEQYVKFNLQKNTGSGYTYVLGTATTGVKASDYASVAGTLTGTDITRGKIDAGEFTSTATHSYKLIAWVSEDYDLVTTDSNDGTCSIAEHTDKDACVAADGVWTTVHETDTTAQVYKFKIKVFATQL